MKRSYHVFTHLLSGDGQLRAQKDNPPVHGSYPTTRWVPGEIVIDGYQIPIPSDAPVGAYDLVVGMYDLLTLERLTVRGGEVANAVHLTTVQVRDSEAM
jgi:hypothetical protein